MRVGGSVCSVYIRPSNGTYRGSIYISIVYINTVGENVPPVGTVHMYLPIYLLCSMEYIEYDRVGHSLQTTAT